MPFTCMTCDGLLRAPPQVLQQTEAALAGVERKSEAQREAHRCRTRQQGASAPSADNLPGRGGSAAHGEAREYFEARLRAKAEGEQAAAPSAAEEEEAEDAAAQVLLVEVPRQFLVAQCSAFQGRIKSKCVDSRQSARGHVLCV